MGGEPTLYMDTVAPVWGRGLKFHTPHTAYLNGSRPRMGAWIEISKALEIETLKNSRPRMGAWIEMKSL